MGASLGILRRVLIYLYAKAHNFMLPEPSETPMLAPGKASPGEGIPCAMPELGSTVGSAYSHHFSHDLRTSHVVIKLNSIQ